MKNNISQLLKATVMTFLTVMLASCASAPKNTTPLTIADLSSPKDSKSIIYLYRLAAYNTIQPGANPVVKINGNKIGSLVRDQYLQFETGPGNHRITFGGFWWATVDTASYEFSTTGEELIFLSFVTRGPKIIPHILDRSRKAGVIRVDQSKALIEMSRLYRRPGD